MNIYSKVRLKSNGDRAFPRHRPYLCVTFTMKIFQKRYVNPFSQTIVKFFINTAVKAKI